MATSVNQPAPNRREILAWAMYDFANSGYTTVVLTTLFNSYFVSVIAASYDSHATAVWTLVIAISNLLVLLSAPLLGAIADKYAWKKRMLFASTMGCIVATALLSLPGAGDLWLAAGLILLSNFMFGTGENMIAAFIPELARNERVGRLSGFGWAVGYAGGVLVLLGCLWYVNQVESSGGSIDAAIHGSMIITAVCFLLAATPTLIWLRERATPSTDIHTHWFKDGYTRLGQTLVRLPQLPDLRRFMLALIVFTSGIYTVVILAGIYAEQVLGMGTADIIRLIIIVNITAAIGAFVFGHLQDWIGAIHTLSLTLLIWITAIVMLVIDLSLFNIAAHLIGLALGASQAVGRALIACFTPPARQGEFFGLWGLAVKLSSIIGPLTYALMITLAGGKHEPALLATLGFFVVGLLILWRVDVTRGQQAATQAY
ncbi:MAG: MFS transporter [Granulosicoccaceae bacterium]